ncbi:MAG: hypothetical protein KDD39_03405, partial [Bdellovibrionales bacterium]|nr:hypothetical protein [Bdellovibrionales bacterium]
MKKWIAFCLMGIGGLSPADPPGPEKLHYMVDQALLSQATFADRVAADVLRRLYEREPDLDPVEGGRFAYRIKTAWDNKYGPLADRTRREALGKEATGMGNALV